MISSRRASGLHPITASTATGRWRLQASLKVSKLERSQLPITQREAPKVSEERLCLSQRLKVREKKNSLSFSIVWFSIQRISPNIYFGVLRHKLSFKTFPKWLPEVTVRLRLSQLCQSLCFHSALLPPGHFLLLSVSPAAEDSGTCEYHLTSPVLPRSNEYCIFQVALFEAGPSVGNLTLMIQPVLSTSAPRSVVLNRRNHDDRRSAK